MARRIFLKTVLSLGFLLFGDRDDLRPSPFLNYFIFCYYKSVQDTAAFMVLTREGFPFFLISHNYSPEL